MIILGLLLVLEDAAKALKPHRERLQQQKEVPKNPQHCTKLIQAKYPRAEREIIMSFEGSKKEELN
jgi:hypothetical protein